MDYLSLLFIVSNQKKEFISIQRVKMKSILYNLYKANSNALAFVMRRLIG